MSFVEAIQKQFDEWDAAENYWDMEDFWTRLASKGETTIDGYDIKVLKVTGGPNDSYGDDYEFVLEVDGKPYIAIVDYDSYEYSGNQWSVYHAEPYEVTETRYKRLVRAR